MSRWLQPSMSVRAYFGWRLRHWRRARGFTQAGLGRRLGYADSHISRVESAERWPPPDLADRCDALLDTGGELIALWPLVERERMHTARMSAAMDAADGGASTGRPGAEGVAALGRLLRVYRDIGEALGGRDIVVPVEHHARLLIRWHADGPRPAAAGMLRLAAEYAELAGWTRFDGADYAGALYWYDHGHRWAAAAGDPHLASRLLARQSAARWSTGDAAGAIVLAEAARRLDGLDAGTRAWATLAKARGHALAGDRPACERALHDATTLVEDADPTRGPRWLRFAGSVLLLTFGTCYRDLALRTGHKALAQRAVTYATESLAGVPARSGHDRALVATRLASAYAFAGEPDPAAATLTTVMDGAGAYGSERVAGEVRAVHARLAARWPERPAVQDLSDRLAALGDDNAHPQAQIHHWAAGQVERLRASG